MPRPPLGGPLRPASGFYLWVLEVNTPARRFYERLGARNAESATSEPPGGGTIVGLRYVWPTPGRSSAARDTSFSVSIRLQIGAYCADD